MVPVSDDAWAFLADQFVDGAYESGDPPRSLPTMPARAEQKLAAEAPAVRDRVRLVQARGEDAAEATGGQRFTAVLCHGVLMYVDHPDPLITSLCRCAGTDGIVSVMASTPRPWQYAPHSSAAGLTRCRPSKPALNAGSSMSIPGGTPSRNYRSCSELTRWNR